MSGREEKETIQSECVSVVDGQEIHNITAGYLKLGQDKEGTCSDDFVDKKVSNINEDDGNSQDTIKTTPSSKQYDDAKKEVVVTCTKKSPQDVCNIHSLFAERHIVDMHAQERNSTTQETVDRLKNSVSNID